MGAEEPQPPFFLGIDLGGTQIKAGVVDDRGRKVHAIEPIPTEVPRGPEVGLDNLARAGRIAVEQSGLKWEDIAGVGLGSPGTMDIRAGLLLDPVNLQ
ncbi:MAG TPA: ROK family protein, partial [Isosphaeraceae bacterium]